jgi:Tol biopolymer transport system component
VAYCTGTLAEPTLRVLDVRSGTPRRLGRGVHPAWLPGGQRLIYARPAGVERRGRRGNVTGAELVLHDLEAERTQRLTDTAAYAEMQPVVAPDGLAVVFADWHGGGLYRAALEPAAPWTGGTP